MTGGLRFLAWVRDGMVGDLAGQPGIDDALPARAHVPIGVSVNGGTEAGSTITLTAQVYGPGDVTGLDSRQIIRSFPAPGTSNAEVTSLAHVEFDRPDLPWMFTPIGPTAEGRLRPWLTLVVVPTAGAKISPATKTSLPSLACEAAELPDPADCWAFAHAQLTLRDSGEPVAGVLASDPDRTLSRLLCPRRLRPATQYTACVVPTFEAGRKAGLGIDLGPDDEADLSPSWTAGETGTVTLPIYHHWSFATGPEGDFESLVRRLKARVMPDSMGQRPMDLSAAGPGLPQLRQGDPGSVLGLEGALRAPTAMPTVWPETVRDAWHTAMTTLLAGWATRLTPPVYGAVHADAPGLPSPQEGPRWLRELNLDPRSRAAAAFGTQVVQRHQEALAASAWEQAAELRDANALLRRAQLARAASASLYRRVVDGPALSPGALAQVTRPAAPSITAGPRTTRTVLESLATSPGVLAVTSTAFRRVARPRGPLARRLNGGAAPLVAPVEAVASAALSARPVAAAPAGMVAISDLADDLTFRKISPALVAASPAWWRPPPSNPAPDLGAVPTTVATDPSDVSSSTQFFVGTADGRLFEHRLVGSRWFWRDHGQPPHGSVATTPTMVAGAQRVLAATKDGRLVERRWDGDRWIWVDHGAPPGATITTAPAACGSSVFAVTSARRMVELTESGTWADHGVPPGNSLIGNPGAALGGTTLFMRTGTGGLAQLSRVNGAWQWTVHPELVFSAYDPGDTVDRLPDRADVNDGGTGGTVTIKRPTVTDPGGAMSGPRVFAGVGYERFATSGSIAMLEHTGSTWTWRVIATRQIVEAPGGAMLDSKCFAASSDGHLLEIVRSGSTTDTWEVVDHGTPAAGTVVGQPGAATESRLVFVRTSTGTLAALDWRNGAWQWEDHGTPLDVGGQGGWNAAPPTPPDGDGTWAQPIALLSSLLVGHVDDPNGPNRVYHRVGANLGLDGVPRNGWTAPIPDTGPTLPDHTVGLGMAVADISGNGKPDLLVLTVTPGFGCSTASYTIGWDLSPGGQVTGGWSAAFPLPDPLSSAIQAVDVTLADLDGDGRPELLLAYATGGSEEHRVYYRVGWGIDTTGRAGNGWSDSKQVPGWSPGTVRGLGVAVSDLDDDGRPDLLVLVMEERDGSDCATYRIGQRVNRRGNVTGSWSAEQRMGGSPLWPKHAGVGVAIADVNGSRRPDLIVFRIEDRPTDNLGWYRIGYDLDSSGAARSWSDDVAVPGWFGWENKGAAIVLADLDPTLLEQREAMAGRYVAASTSHQDKLTETETLARSERTPQVQLAPITDRLQTALDPEQTVPTRALAQVRLGSRPLAAAAPQDEGVLGPGDPLRDLVASVSFPVPAYELLREVSQDLVLPGVEATPPETVTLLRANPGFIEAFMVGLNHEMSRELLWRDFPGDFRTTYFRSFWDTRGTTNDATEATDIPPISQWRSDVPLGDNATDVGAAGEGHLVLLVRGEVLRRYPDAVVTARRATFAADGVGHTLSTEPEVLPIFCGTLSPDLLFFGFPLSVAAARGSSTDPGWFFVLREHPAAPRFGVDEPPETNPAYGQAPTASWRDLDWANLAKDAASLAALEFVPARGAPFAEPNPPSLEGVTWARNGGHMAAALLQLPVQVAIHASDMIHPVDDGWHVTSASRRSHDSPAHRVTALAGLHGDGTTWQLSVEQVIAAVERGERFYVTAPDGSQIKLVVSHTHAGRRYLRTTADGIAPDNLLALPEPDPS